MSPDPRVAAVVLNWCAEDDTAACVRSLAEQKGVSLATLIVDNASPDGSGARLAARFADGGFLQTGENLGYAGGNARGIASALDRWPAAEYVLVINDDAEVTAGCVAALVAALDDDLRAAAAAPTVVHAEPAGVVWWAGGRFDAMRALGMHERFGVAVGDLPAEARPGTAPREVTALSGCVMLLRAAVIRELGSFREEFFAYLEDTDLSLRWRRAGHRLLHVPSAMATHKVRYPAAEPSASQIRLRDRNRRRVAQLHLGAAARIRFHLWFWATRVMHAARYASRGDGARLRAIVRGATER